MGNKNFKNGGQAGPRGVYLKKGRGREPPYELWWWAITEKHTNRGVEEMLFEKTPGNFRFLTLPLKISDKKKVHPWKLQNCVIPLGNFKA